MSAPKATRKDTTDECPIVSELTRHFRANNKHGIVKCLAQLKSDPKRCKEFAMRSNSLDILIQLLRCKNDAIVNMSLSILADACMAFDVREKVKNSKIAINVLLIIKNLKLDTKLHCRACRLVSNLSECSWHVKELCDAGAVKALMPILILKTNTQTYCMAVRAMRNIWSSYTHIRETMIELQIIKLVTQLFVMAEEKSYEDAKHAELVDACLKAMCVFLVTRDPRCGEQMQSDKDIQGYKCLMRCCNKGNNKMATQCLYILCQIPECRLGLGIAGRIEEIIALIKSLDSSSSEQLYKEILSLCLFCRESVNRNKIKNSDGLQLIIALLNNSKHQRYHSALLHGLAQFSYDDNALEILAKHGILDILVAKLKDVIAMIVDDDKNNTSRKRFSDYPPENQKTPSKYTRIYVERTRFSMDYHRDDWSPRSFTSASSSSPPSTPPLPPCSDSNAETDTDDDDIYSPICSDTECGDNDEDEETASLKSYKSMTIVEADFDLPSVSSETSGKINACDFYYSLVLLHRLSLYLKPIDGLADPKIIKPLTNYIKYSKKQTYQKYRVIVTKILMRIMNNAAYFLPLLKQGLVFDLQTLPEAEDCTRRLRTVAETGGAIGQMSFILLRGEEEEKLLTAVSIPLLIKTHRNLKCLLDKYGGLQLIFRLLTESSHKLHESAIWSISQLARTLQLHPIDQSITIARSIMKVSNYSRLSLDDTIDHTTVSSTVTFELDDGTTVEACRRMLCRRSDFFSAMLEGSFSESGKRRVRLKNTSRDGLNTLILAANGATLEHENIESLLDATVLADKFLMSDLLDPLTETSLAKLNYENVYRAWNWARSYSYEEWRSYCVKSLLTKLSWSEMVEAFRNFYATDIFDEFLHEVRDIIEYVLCQY